MTDIHVANFLNDHDFPKNLRQSIIDLPMYPNHYITFVINQKLSPHNIDLTGETGYGESGLKPQKAMEDGASEDGAST